MSRGQIEIFLQPGEFHFGDRSARLSTLLGSCVAITLWHPRWLTGGMCHFLLPTRGRTAGVFDARYGDEAMALFVEAAAARGTRMREYEAKVFGGGNMFRGGSCAAPLDVGSRNVAAANNMLIRHGLAPRAASVGKYGYRNVFFDLATGHVWVRHVSTPVQTLQETEAWQKSA